MTTNGYNSLATKYHYKSLATTNHYISLETTTHLWPQITSNHKSQATTKHEQPKITKIRDYRLENSHEIVDVQKSFPVSLKKYPGQISRGLMINVLLFSRIYLITITSTICYIIYRWQNVCRTQIYSKIRPFVRNCFDLDQVFKTYIKAVRQPLKYFSDNYPSSGKCVSLCSMITSPGMIHSTFQIEI